MTAIRLSDNFCKMEGHLTRAAENYPGFIFDLEAARQLVAEGVIETDEAIERVHHAGEISTSVTAQLKLCMGRIAAGDCPIYAGEQ